MNTWRKHPAHPPVVWLTAFCQSIIQLVVHLCRCRFRMPRPQWPTTAWHSDLDFLLFAVVVARAAIIVNVVPGWSHALAQPVSHAKEFSYPNARNILISPWTWIEPPYPQPHHMTNPSSLNHPGFDFVPNVPLVCTNACTDTCTKFCTAAYTDTCPNVCTNGKPFDVVLVLLQETKSSAFLRLRPLLVRSPGRFLRYCCNTWDTQVCAEKIRCQFELILFVWVWAAEQRTSSLRAITVYQVFLTKTGLWPQLLL